MRILIVSQYFWPETFRINDLAIELVQRGHEVFVLTGKPNYPKGKIFEGYHFFTWSREVYNGIKIFRVPIIPRGKASGAQLAVNYASYVLFACLFIFFKRYRFDVSLTFAISPITQVYPALLHKKLFKSRAYLWVQDLWPESVAAAGKVKSLKVLEILNQMVKFIYQKSDAVLVQSKGFIPSICEKGINFRKIFYIPNWAEDFFLNEPDPNLNKYRSLVPSGFVVMFAGNIGESQDFESILSAAEKTMHLNEIKWVILGDGRRRSWVENEVRNRKLSKTFFLLGSYPVEEMPYFFQFANLMLLPLKDEPIFSLTIPSKIQSYLASGKPIATMLNGVGNEVIREAGCGFIAKAGEYNKLAENILSAYSSQSEVLDKMGNRGKIFYEKEFQKQSVINRLLEVIDG